MTYCGIALMSLLQLPMLIWLEYNIPTTLMPFCWPSADMALPLLVLRGGQGVGVLNALT